MEMFDSVFCAFNFLPLLNFFLLAFFAVIFFATMVPPLD
jgi:hypothetical protein